MYAFFPNFTYNNLWINSIILEQFVRKKFKMNRDTEQYRYIKMTIEYEGTDFAGWQIQPDQRTVQKEIETGLFKMTKKEIRVTASGRTDAGVHALGQVLSFKTDSSLPITAFSKGLNSYLPEDIRVIDAEMKTEKFDARKDAINRTYRYIISTRPKVIGRQYCWYPQCDFQLHPIMMASEYLKGEHNFASFCKKESEGYYDNISTVHTIEWKSIGDEIIFQINAVRFFHNMIRIIIGTFIEVGKGNLTPEDFKQILEARNRELAGPTAPPYGLYLIKVHYKN